MMKKVIYYSDIKQYTRDYDYTAKVPWKKNRQKYIGKRNYEEKNEE